VHRVPAVLDRELAARGGRTRDEWVKARPSYVIGTPDEVVQRLREFASAGVAYAIVLLPYRHERALLPLLAREVLPALA
jgi:alkanesulfonate monooxygenase SsuD/methylene tetrahydromethanopterin reductase-like flavin-dependent oxidoreductase (luciferase family)